MKSSFDSTGNGYLVTQVESEKGTHTIFFKKKTDLKYNYCFCFFGFVRDMPLHDADLINFKKYLRIPKLRYEDKDKDVSNEDLLGVFGDNSVVDLYDYDKRFFYTEAKAMKVPDVIMWNQQPSRVLSFYKHIKDVLLLLKNYHKKESPEKEDVIILMRADASIKNVDFEKIDKIISSNDIIVDQRAVTHGAGYNDHYFVFKEPSIDTFISLYEDYKKYLEEFYERVNPDDLPGFNSAAYAGHVNHCVSNGLLPTTRSEDIFKHHFEQYKKTVAVDQVIKYNLDHVCHMYCGHQGGDMVTFEETDFEAKLNVFRSPDLKRVYDYNKDSVTLGTISAATHSAKDNSGSPFTVGGGETNLPDNFSLV